MRWWRSAGGGGVDGGGVRSGEDGSQCGGGGQLVAVEVMVVVLTLVVVFDVAFYCRGVGVLVIAVASLHWFHQWRGSDSSVFPPNGLIPVLIAMVLCIADLLNFCWSFE